MAAWDIGFEITALIRLDVRNPNDRLVFKLLFLQDNAMNLVVKNMNRSQILAYFNVMAITGKVTLPVESAYTDVVNRLLWAAKDGDRKVYELELIAKSKRSISYVKSETLPYSNRLEVHQPSAVAFMKLNDLKIVRMDPTLAVQDDNRRVTYYKAVFDGS
jgi:hypothetical protein